MGEHRNLIIAIVISIVVMIFYPFFYTYISPPPVPVETTTDTATSDAPPAPADPAVEAELAEPALRDRVDILAETPRIAIENARVSGSISLVGGRIDDLILNDYRETVDPNSPRIVLLSPAGSADTYYSEFGWVASDNATPVPTSETVWKTDGERLTPTTPLVMTWDNGAGLVFTREIAVDQDYLFTITQSVANSAAVPVTLYPYGLISRHGTPQTLGFFILHEGLIGVLDGKLQEIDYDDVRDDGAVELQSPGGWLGFADKYWLTALVPEQSQQIAARFSHTLRNDASRYQTDYRGAGMTIAPGETGSSENHFFAGAKEVRLLDRYESEQGFPLFDRGVDWGWFYFLTKPIFHTLDYIFKYVGNFGVAILLLTVLVKALFYPLANKSYRAMSKMKALTPEMKRIREQFTDDKLRQQQEMMALYKKEKVNPASGCLPILVQIPVFFALYKVLFVTIEMRHAPFFGWIQDLSAPDPTSWMNLFGLLPYTVPELGFFNLLSIGIWPIVMGLTMWLQMRLNPTPPDPTQAKIMAALPFVFTFMLGHFAAGLVIYWAWNNTLSIAQQRLIMWRMGVKP
jgi:YidC/Oxa1 family membrane protein insertase